MDGSHVAGAVPGVSAAQASDALAAIAAAPSAASHGPLDVLRAARPSVRAALQRAGYTRCEQLAPLTPLQLAAAARLSVEAAAAVLDEVWYGPAPGTRGSRKRQRAGDTADRSAAATTGGGGGAGAVASTRGAERPLPFGRSAFDLWRADQHDRAERSLCIPTFCRELDDLLGGGVALGALTELCGVPGVGKTQVCLQLAVAVQLPLPFGGPRGRCLFVDTEGSFIAGRFAEVASAAVAQVQHLAHQQQHAAAAGLVGPEALGELRRGVEHFTVQRILETTQHFRAHSLVDVVALVHALPSLLAADRDIRLVVVDSIAFHFRALVGGDYGLRSRLLFLTAQHLQRTCRAFGVAVVVTNQMTSRMLPAAGVAGGASARGIRGGGGGSGAQTVTDIVPALGDAWAHGVSTRLLLTADGGSAVQRRYATLEKCPGRPLGDCVFRITGKGIRGMPPPPRAS